jgi:protein-S-isoprenylcysteine O-methyltransferase Ste14
MGAIRLLFAVAVYGLFFAAFLYLIGFVGNLYVPRSIDIGPAAPQMTALLVNAGLIALFGLQHSIMARRGFKAALTRVWPASIERSLYVLATTAVLVLLYWLWRPLPELVWSAQAEWLRTLLWALFFAGWGIVLLSTFLLNHFELFGLQQAWSGFRGTALPAGRFRNPLFYRLVRHPIYTGFLIAFWATPDMSQGHLLFAIGMTIYILIGIRYEERDLAAHLGVQYSEYRVRVGMLVPGIGKARSPGG